MGWMMWRWWPGELVQKGHFTLPKGICSDGILLPCCRVPDTKVVESPFASLVSWWGNPCKIIKITTWGTWFRQHCLKCCDGSLLYLDRRHISSAYVDIFYAWLLHFQSVMFSNTGHLCRETMFVKCKHKFNWMHSKYTHAAVRFHIKNESSPC